VVNLRFGREDELESDDLAVKFAAPAGYDPRAMINVMQMLSSQGGAARSPNL
jgi:predicted Zn-dependent protease